MKPRSNSVSRGRRKGSSMLSTRTPTAPATTKRRTRCGASCSDAPIRPQAAANATLRAAPTAGSWPKATKSISGGESRTKMSRRSTALAKSRPAPTIAPLDGARDQSAAQPRCGRPVPRDDVAGDERRDRHHDPAKGEDAGDDVALGERQHDPDEAQVDDDQRR